MEGAPLASAARALTLAQKADLMRKVAAAVGFLNKRSMVHRDLKPDNILVGPDLEPKLLDFGLTLQLAARDTRLTQAGQIMGTPDYFSPEQARGGGPFDSRCDVFSLGVILYELLTGMLPFRAESLAQQLQAICEQDPVLPRRINPEVPRDLQNVCMKALEKDPANRYNSADEMAAEL